MPIIKNGKNISAVYKGDTPIAKIYKGANVVWEAFKTLMLSGIPPLSFTSVGKPLIDYKIYGNSKQKTILPDEYQQVEYIKTTGTQYIDTGVPLKSGLKMITDWIYQDATSGNSYTGGHIGTPGNRWLVGSQRNGNYYFAVGTSNVSTEFEYGNRDVIEAYWADKASYIKVNGVNSTAVNYKSYALGEEPDYTFYLGATNRNGIPASIPRLTIYGCKFYQDDVLLRDYIPCYRKSDNEIGLYDLVNNVFYANNGTGKFSKGNDIIANPTPENPIKLENVGDKTKNLINIKTITKNYYLNSTGTPVSHTTTTGNFWSYTDFIEVSPQTEYTFTTTTYGTAPKICMYNSSKEFIGYADQALNFTTIADTFYIRLNVFSDINDKPQLEEGSRATTYEPYGYKIPVEITNSGTYLIYGNEQLAKMGEYFDFIDYENQNITREVGVYTFDGTENWEAHKENDDNVVYRLDNVLTPLLNAPTSATYMTHFALTDIYSTASFTAGLYRFGFDQDKLTITSSRLYVSSDKMTVVEFKAWLAENKPTIYYPIAPTEETIELPEIPTIKGKNILDINTEIKPSNVEITYKGK